MNLGEYFKNIYPGASRGLIFGYYANILVYETF